MILCIRTDSGVTELYICSGTMVEAQDVWESGRTLAGSLLAHINKLVSEASSKLGIQADIQNLDGIVCYLGPGSFTGLRIGVTVANTLAYSLGVPVIGVTGDDWLREGQSGILFGRDDKVLLPQYGAEANITAPRK